jgi:hypothetical protein
MSSIANMAPVMVSKVGYHYNPVVQDHSLLLVPSQKPDKRIV